MNYKYKILLILCLVTLLVPVMAFATSHDLPDIGSDDSTGFICRTDDNLASCVPRLYNFALGISGLIAMGIIIWAGYLYLTAGGNGEQVGHAKEMIFAVLSGLTILATAYILLKFLDPKLVQIKNLEDINIDAKLPESKK